MRSTSKRLTLSSLLAVLFLVGSVGSAHAQLGVTAGLNFESAGDIETTEDNNATLENSTGYHLGLLYELDVGPLAVRPGLRYRKVGSFDLSQVDDDLTDPYSVSAWEVPVDLKLSVLTMPLVSSYILAGPKASFLQGEGDFDGALENVSYTLNVGVGVNISLPAAPFTLQPEFAYDFGATRFVKDDETVTIGDTDFTPRDSPQFSAFALRLNVLF